MKAPRIEDYYQSADLFFLNNLPVGLTYDDADSNSVYDRMQVRATSRVPRGHAVCPTHPHGV